MSPIITAASAIMLGVWGTCGARLMWRVERRPEPIPVETEVSYETQGDDCVSPNRSGYRQVELVDNRAARKLT